MRLASATDPHACGKLIAQLGALGVNIDHEPRYFQDTIVGLVTRHAPYMHAKSVVDTLSGLASAGFAWDACTLELQW